MKNNTYLQRKFIMQDHLPVYRNHSNTALDGTISFIIDKNYTVTFLEVILSSNAKLL